MVTTNIPIIAPVPDGIVRPRWSVMIPTFNCADYLRQTLQSVLAQDQSAEHMQIEVIDDCSTRDDPERVVREVGQGRVFFFRQPHNVGISANFNTCIERSRGHWVHILHGDDFVLPGFYKALGPLLASDAGIGAAFCRHIFVDEEGHWQRLSSIEARSPCVLANASQRLGEYTLMQTPSIVVRRQTYERVGGYRASLPHCADWDMWKRISADAAIAFHPEPLACYRVHAASDTSRLRRTGANVADLRRSVLVSHAERPDVFTRAITRRALRGQAYSALFSARRYLAKRDLPAAWAQIREAAKCSCGPGFLLALLSTFCWASWRFLCVSARTAGKRLGLTRDD